MSLSASPVAVPEDETREPPESCHDLRLQLGGCVVGVVSPDTAWLSQRQERFAAFLSQYPPELVIEHRPSSRQPRWYRNDTNVVAEGTIEARDFDFILTDILPGLLTPDIVVHGALLADADHTYLCCGPSGAGKSTLAALLPERALCDELAVVRTTPTDFVGVSLPYWVARPGAAPLAGVFVLEHALHHRRVQLSPTEAVRELRRHVCWPTEQPEAVGQVFDTLTRLVEAIPVYRLGFRPDPSVWDLITAPAQ